jgi:hypothetical protein
MEMVGGAVEGTAAPLWGRGAGKRPCGGALLVLDGGLNDGIEVDEGAAKDGMEGCDDADVPDTNEGMDMTFAEAGRGFSSSLSDPLSLLLLLK